MSSVQIEDAEAAFAALKLSVRNLERDLESDEEIGIISSSLNAIDLKLYQIVQHGPVIIVLGHDADGQAHQLIFAPSQISFRMVTRKTVGERRPIGFEVR